MKGFILYCDANIIGKLIITRCIDPCNHCCDSSNSHRIRSTSVCSLFHTNSDLYHQLFVIIQKATLGFRASAMLELLIVLCRILKTFHIAEVFRFTDQLLIYLSDNFISFRRTLEVHVRIFRLLNLTVMVYNQKLLHRRRV